MFNVVFTDSEEEQMFSCPCHAVPRVGEFVSYVYGPDQDVPWRRLPDSTGRRFEVIKVVHVLHGTKPERDEQIILCVIK